MAAAAIIGTACQKHDGTSPLGGVESSKEITFLADGLDVAGTKTTPVTTASLNSFYVAGYDLQSGDLWNGNIITATKSGSVFNTGKYFPGDGTYEYAFFASNVEFEYADGSGVLEVENCNTDVIAVYAQSDYSAGTPVELYFGHILTRVGTVTVNTQSGYELLSASATLKGGITTGRYCLGEDTWATEDSTPSDKPLAAFSGSTSVRTSTNDLWLVPVTGGYDIQITYTLRKGDYSQTFTKTATADLQMGRINNITVTAVGGNAQEIQATVTVQPWGNNNIVASLDPIISFQDAGVKDACVSWFDANGDGELSEGEAAAVTTEMFEEVVTSDSFTAFVDGSQSDIYFSELQYFTGLDYIDSHWLTLSNECEVQVWLTIPSSVESFRLDAHELAFDGDSCQNLVIYTFTSLVPPTFEFDIHDVEDSTDLGPWFLVGAPASALPAYRTALQNLGYDVSTWDSGSHSYGYFLYEAGYENS